MTNSKTLRLGTRGSDLARTQSTTVADALRAAGHEVELTIIKTAGDRDQTGAFSSIGPQGVFVREIETALVERRIELAVHSFKDLPTTSPAELVDRRGAEALRPCRPAARAHRQARGNGDGLAAARRRRARRHRVRAPARLARALPPRSRRSSRCAATCRRASAGCVRASSTRSCSRPPASSACGTARRLDGALDGITVLRLDPQRFVPAPAQGALAVQCRLDDARVREALAALDHSASHAAVDAERDALRRAEGGCDIAFGAYFVHGDQDAGRRPGAIHELLGMHERAGRVRAARVRGTDPRKLGADALGKARRRARRRAMTAAANALAGRRILLTRSAEDCAEWAEQIARRGAEAVALPCIHCETLDTPALRAALQSRARRRGLGRVHVAARSRSVRGAVQPAAAGEDARRGVGAATADAARASARPRGPVGRGTGAALARAARGRRRSRAAAERADRDRRERRRRVGANARGRRRALHAARPLSHDRRAAGGDQAARCRRSARSVSCSRARRPSSGFVHQVELDAPVAIYTIGPSTTAAARALGSTVTAEAREPSLEGILEAMQ